MQLHNLISITKHRRGKRIGRGGKRGTYSGRGTKGQRARAGAKIRPAERELLKKIPKLRGYKFKSFRRQSIVVNLGDLDKKFKNGDTVSPEVLMKTGIVPKVGNRLQKIKILGGGDLKKKLIFKDVLFSKSALEKIKLLG